MQAETLESSLTPQEIEALLSEARAKVAELGARLYAIDAELDAIAIERRQHTLLQSAVDALNELEELGGAELFWDGVGRGTSAEHSSRMRARIETFQQRVSAIEERRSALVEEMRQQQNDTDLLEDDAFEAQEEEERRRNEWIIEREIDAIRSRPPIMPWTRGGEDDKRFRKSLGSALLVVALVTLLVFFVDLPLSVLKDQTVEVPKRVVTMMAEKHVQPPPVEVKPQPRVVQQKPVEKPEPQRAAKTDKTEQKPKETPEPEQGILAFREKLESFKDVPVVAHLGSQARVNAASSAAAPERAMLTTNAPGSSGGIKLAALSRNFGPGGGTERGAIQGAALTRASSNISAIGPADRPLSGGPGLSRTDEEIQIVFDRYKSSLYRLYNRELRKDPTLQGKMILRLTIEPDGTVSFCQLQSTDMNAPELSAQVVDRVKTFNFGAKEVPAITIVYPIDFLPAA